MERPYEGALTVGRQAQVRRRTTSRWTSTPLGCVCARRGGLSRSFTVHAAILSAKSRVATSTKFRDRRLNSLGAPLQVRDGHRPRPLLGQGGAGDPSLRFGTQKTFLGPKELDTNSLYAIFFGSRITFLNRTRRQEIPYIVTVEKRCSSHGWCGHCHAPLCISLGLV